MFRLSLVAAVLALTTITAAAQSANPQPSSSIAVEADAIAYGLPGYSGIVSVTLKNNLQMAFGIGRYEVPGFLLEGDANYDAVQWKATATSVQVFRATYRFRGAMKSGPAVGAVILNQQWRLSAEKLAGSSKFNPLNVGITAGYYFHVGKHFYIYPTTAFTYNTVISGTAGLQGTPYKVARFAPNASLHVGWEWAR